MKARARPLLALTFTACLPEGVALKLPDATGKRTMLIAVEAGGALTAEVFALDDGPSPALLHDFHGEASAYVFYDDAEPRALGLTPGPLPITAEEPSRAIPGFDALYAAHATPDGAGEWTPLDAPPPALADVRIRLAEDACRAFDVLPLAFTAGATRAVGAALDGEHAIVALQTRGELYRVSPDGSYEALEAPDGFAPGTAFGADGEVWFAMENALLRWSIGQGFGERLVYEPGASFTWLDGARGGAAFELFAVGWLGEVVRFDAAGSTLIGTAEPNVLLFGGAGAGVAWTGPGEATAIARETNIAFRTTRAPAGGVAVERMEWPVLDRGLASTVADVPGFGLVIPTRLGWFYVRGADGLYTTLPYGRFEGPFRGIGKINSVVALPPRSLLFAGAIDFVSEYDREAGFCDAIDLGLDLDVRKLVPFGGVYLASGHNDSGSSDGVVAAILSPR